MLDTGIFCSLSAYCVYWSALWIALLRMGEGPYSDTSSYRLHFWHGVLSSLVAFLCLQGFIGEVAATPCTLSYFVVDFVKNLLQDYYYKLPSYQKGSQRIAEYGHHIFCFTVVYLSVAHLSHFCYADKFSVNPAVQLMFAEFSTPFLHIWRVSMSGTSPSLMTVFLPFMSKSANQLTTKSEIIPSPGLGVIFLLAFIACRFVYHAYMVLPFFANNCETYYNGVIFQYLYNLMNIYFLYFIIQKIRGSSKKPKET